MSHSSCCDFPLSLLLSPFNPMTSPFSSGPISFLSLFFPVSLKTKVEHSFCCYYMDISKNTWEQFHSKIILVKNVFNPLKHFSGHFPSSFWSAITLRMFYGHFSIFNTFIWPSSFFQSWLLKLVAPFSIHLSSEVTNYFFLSLVLFLIYQKNHIASSILFYPNLHIRKPRPEEVNEVAQCSWAIKTVVMHTHLLQRFCALHLVKLFFSIF